MKASILDLRYKMKQVLKALERNEKITILYHGKEKGILIPHRNKKKIPVKEHPFFSMYKKEEKSVETQMEELRGSRYDAL
jgi:antitoxin (DNA-binding transcriptional repressor) of toxin-antitoxin stability system